MSIEILNIPDLELKKKIIQIYKSEYEKKEGKINQSSIKLVKNIMNSREIKEMLITIQKEEYLDNMDYESLARIEESASILSENLKEVKEKVELDQFFSKGYNLDINELKKKYKERKLGKEFPNLDFDKIKELYVYPPKELVTHYDENKKISIDAFVFRKYFLAILQMIFNHMDFVVCNIGDEGCLTGDTQIQLSRKKLSRRYSLERIYNAFQNNELKLRRYHKWDLECPTYVRSFNGKEIRLHKIKAVHYSGIKKVYQLVLNNGLKIKATQTHKFLRKEGWARLAELEVGDKIMCDTLKAEGKKRKRIKLYDIQLPVDYHPYSKNGRVEVHRLIYEAYINKIHFTEYLDILLNEKECARKLFYIDPSKYDVHHKDGNHYNNSIENLQVLNKKEHGYIHAENAYSNFSQGVPKWSEVISIEELGEEKTYDIECEDPHHNFVANGVVVHNSGKSCKCSQDMYMVWWIMTQIGIIEYEFNIKEMFANTLQRFSELEDKYYGIPFRIIGLDEGNELNRQDWKEESVKLFWQRLRRERYERRIKFINIPVLGEMIINIVLSRINFIFNMLNRNEVKTGTLFKGNYDFYIIPRGDKIYSPYLNRELKKEEIKNKLYLNLKDKEYLKGLPKDIRIKRCYSNGVWAFKEDDYIKELKETNRAYRIHKGIRFGLSELYAMYKARPTLKALGVRKGEVIYASLNLMLHKIKKYWNNDPELLLKYETIFRQKLEEKEDAKEQQRPARL